MLKRLSITAALALVAISSAPQRAEAACTTSGSVVLGFGGYFSGCYTSFDVARFFENAGDVSTMGYLTNPLARDPVTNAPIGGSNTLFDNNCGSSGATSTTGVFCNPNQLQTFGWGLDMELVFALNNTNKNTWIYSGTDPNRNAPPVPGGVQNWLWQVVGGTWDGWYLFGWEDLNSGCFAANSLTGGTTVDGTMLDATHLGAKLVSCTGRTAGGNSDDDYNDFYVLVRPTFRQPPTEVVPEPMTMTLLATGLLGMGGASVVRRRRNR